MAVLRGWHRDYPGKESWSPSVHERCFLLASGLQIALQASDDTLWQTYAAVSFVLTSAGNQAAMQMLNVSSHVSSYLQKSGVLNPTTLLLNLHVLPKLNPQQCLRKLALCSISKYASMHIPQSSILDSLCSFWSIQPSSAWACQRCGTNPGCGIHQSSGGAGPTRNSRKQPPSAGHLALASSLLHCSAETNSLCQTRRLPSESIASCTKASTYSRSCCFVCWHGVIPSKLRALICHSHSSFCRVGFP